LTNEARPALAAPRVFSHFRWPLALLWAGIVAAIFAFIVFGTVRVGAGNWIGWRMTVRQIWSRFTAYLAEQGASAGIIAVVTAVAVVSLLGAAVVLWLALTVKDLPSDPAPDDIAGQ
jgi:hypothetical protein